MKCTVVGKRVERKDARAKVTGETIYPSDRSREGMLWVVAVRAAHPHARILSIDTERAAAAAGVVRVLTARDVPGENAFGIQFHDMPVLCSDRVRYLGDVVALVGAESRRAARQAAALVAVDYQPLALLTDPEQALDPATPALHPGGNILHEVHFHKGNISVGFQKSAVIVERSYQLPMMDHAFLETEAGLSYFDENDVLCVESCGQYIYRDRKQIASVLGLAEEKIRVSAEMVGGAFGGKDDITVQIQLALMTYVTGRPAKMVASREESIVAHSKRHPASMWFKTGASKSGKLMAVEARFLSDTGAYASLGGPVLNLMAEHAAGPYLVPHVKVDGHVVYTNNGFSGAFRGFGCTQACVGIESQMDLMARALRRDPLAFRQANVLHQGDAAGLGYEMKTAVGAEPTIRAARAGKLYRQRRRIKKDRTHVSPSLAPFIRRGVGVASQMQGLGLGVGIEDQAEVEVVLGPGGAVRVKVGTTEIGQGAYTAYAQMTAERLGVPLEQVEIVGADTGTCPDSGATTASRTTYAVGNAILLAIAKLEQRRSAWAAQGTGRENLSARANFTVPTQDRQLGDGLPHLLYSYGTHVVLVEVNTLTGEISVEAVEAYLDGGRVVSPLGFEGQSEGGIAQGIGYTLFEEVLLDRGRFLNTNFDTYILPSSKDVPTAIHTVPIEVMEKSGPLGAKGISETCTVGVAPAILNALEDAIGIRFVRLPVRAEDVILAREESPHES